MNDDLNIARGLVYGVLMALIVWATLIFAALSIMHGWPWTPFFLAGLCAIGGLLEREL